jgi:phosphatidylinositol alpha-1,6-mannosyltransferase
MAELTEAIGDLGVWVVAPHAEGDATLDRSLPYPIHRYLRRPLEVPFRSAWSRSLRGVETLRGSGTGGAVSLATRSFLLANRHILRHIALQGDALTRAGDRSPVAATLAGTVLPSGGMACLLAERRGIPYAIFAHAAEILVFDEPRRRSWLMRRVLRGATRVAAVSRYTRDLLVDRGVDPARVLLCPPGIDARPFLDPPPDLAEVGHRYGVSGRRVVLCHGRLDPRKGHDVVVAAWPEVLRQVPDALFLVTGDGEMAPPLRAEIVSRGLEDHVRLVGRVPQEDVPALYHLSEVVVMNSRKIGVNVEGFGIVCLEAGAAGKPVVAGRSGGVPDAVEDRGTGFLVDPTDPTDVARRVVEILANAELAARFGAAGRARVLRDFDRPAFARNVRRLTEETMEASAGMVLR